MKKIYSLMLYILLISLFVEFIPPVSWADEYDKEVPVESNIHDIPSLYRVEDKTSVTKMYLTVSEGNSADGTDHTWTEINSYSTYYYDDLGIDRYMAEGILQIDDGDGLVEGTFGYGEETPNVSVQVRGQTSSKAENKNFKIRIKEGKGEYENQRTLDLNKHPAIAYKFNNKLAYDLLIDVPQLMGARTQFVNLFVKDTTAGGNSEFVDYGLYVMVEQINKTYLRNHGLDDRGQLYKSILFEWLEYEPLMVDEEDFDLEEFEKYLEIKGDGDNTLLKSVIADLGNYQIPTEKIIEEHFDVENLSYWMAFQYLIGNYDCGCNNLYIYSPQNSERFYFVCWDQDACFSRSYNDSIGYTEGQSWERGITQHINLTLMKRMLKEEKYRDSVTAAIEDLYNNYITKEKVKSLVDGYSPIVKSFLFEGADQGNSQIKTEAQYDKLMKLIPDEVEANYNYYYDSLNKPWPFYVNPPEIYSDKTVLSWEMSYDCHSEAITYTYILAKDLDFTDVVAEGTGLEMPVVEVPPITDGRYYLRLYATNESGYSCDCFDYAKGRHGKVYGCYAFDVEGTSVKQVEAD